MESLTSRASLVANEHTICCIPDKITQGRLPNITERVNTATTDAALKQTLKNDPWPCQVPVVIRETPL